MVPTVVETLPFGVSRTSARMAENTSSEFMCQACWVRGTPNCRTFVTRRVTHQNPRRSVEALANSIREFIKMENGVVTEPRTLERYHEGGARQHKLQCVCRAMATRSKDGARLKKGSESVRLPESTQVLFVDLDFNNVLGEDRDSRGCLAKFPVQPSFTVESGGGIHALLAHRAHLFENGTETVSRLLKDFSRALANHFKGRG